MLAEELHHGGELPVLGATDDLAADLFLRDQTDPDEAAEMKGQGRRRHAETGLDIADLHAIQASAHQQPVDVQPGQVAELRQALRGEFAVHGPNLTKRTAEDNYIPSFMGWSFVAHRCLTRFPASTPTSIVRRTWTP